MLSSSGVTSRTFNSASGFLHSSILLASAADVDTIEKQRRRNMRNRFHMIRVLVLRESLCVCLLILFSKSCRLTKEEFVSSRRFKVWDNSFMDPGKILLVTVRRQLLLLLDRRVPGPLFAGYPQWVPTYLQYGTTTTRLLLLLLLFFSVYSPSDWRENL